MNIVVYDVAASGGGGETILRQYIDAAKKSENQKWWFIVSLPELIREASDNVNILYQPELNKKGIRKWIHRFIFEHTKLRKIIRQINPDRVLSLQNMTMPKANCPQTVYLHQSLQFAPVKFRFFKKEERSLAVRQRIICRLIQKNLRKADEIIVQTNWMKEAAAKWIGIPEYRIRVEKPISPDHSNHEKISVSRSKNRFFYPANASIYKNHQIIVEACMLLKKQGICDYHINFTLNPSENTHIRALYEKVQKEQLPISFVGYQNRKAMCEKYAECTLLFPSYIETFGLPLQEASAFDAPILVSDCQYAHEVLIGYSHCEYIPWNDANAWAEAMRQKLR